MKIVFLDFDGVLNSTAFFKTRGNRYIPEELDCAAVARLNRILATTGAKIVVSSTWRLGYSTEELQQILVRHGLAGEIVGATPRLVDTDEDGISVSRDVARGLEIQAWIDAQGEAPAAFVILDDMADMEHLRDRLVQTDLDVGLCDAHVDAAVALLMASVSPTSS